MVVKLMSKNEWFVFCCQWSFRSVTYWEGRRLLWRLTFSFTSPYLWTECMPAETLVLKLENEVVDISFPIQIHKGKYVACLSRQGSRCFSGKEQYQNGCFFHVLVKKIGVAAADAQTIMLVAFFGYLHILPLSVDRGSSRIQDSNVLYHPL
ncbi:hypothetical protein AKJ16_DCAP24938 [Drosera capensis]